MHELPIAESILEIALRHAKNGGATRVLQLNLVIGQLSTVVDDSVQFYWDIITADTPAEGSRLTFLRQLARLQCQSCFHEYSLDESELACPSCQSTQIKIVSGQEFFLDSIEVE